MPEYQEFARNSRETALGNTMQTPVTTDAQVTLKKVCMVGANRVGKTSLVRRFVDSIFSNLYETTLGVRIQKGTINLPSNKITCVIWDIHGEEQDRKILPAYYRGMSGYLLFVDGTRRQSLQTALALADDIEDAVGTIPFVLVVSKCDLKDQWEVTQHDLTFLSARAYRAIETSALSGHGVDEAFAALGQAMLDKTM